MIDHAIAYAQRGWPVFPIERRGKRPLTQTGCKAASRSVDQIIEWWTRWPHANVGIATGRGAGLLVVDLDGPEGLANWLELVARHGGDNWRTLAYRTGSGGMHLLYQDHTALPSSASKLADKIDTRGEGGYIVAPPSRHPNGNRYQLFIDRPLADVPAWVRRALRPPVERPRIPASELVPGRRRVPVDRRDRLAEQERAVSEAAEGSRNDTLNRAAYVLGLEVAAGRLGEHEVVDRLTGAALRAGLPRRETDRTIHSGLRAAMSGGAVARPDWWPTAVR